MRNDDPVLTLITLVQRQSFIDFVQTGTLKKDLQTEIQDNIFCQYGLSIRADYEERILFVRQQDRRVQRFLQTLGPEIRIDVLNYLSTDRQTEKLSVYLAANKKMKQAIKVFHQLEAVRKSLWNERIEALAEGTSDPAVILARRFQRLRQFWFDEDKNIEPGTDQLIDPARREEYLFFVTTAIADRIFSEYLNTGFTTIRALKIQIYYEECILFVLAFRARLAAFTKRLDPKCQADFLCSFSNTRAARKLQRYLDAHPETETIIREFMDAEQQLVQQRDEELQVLENNVPFDQTKALSQHLRDLRRRWHEARLGHSY